jgi:DNA (cytosine-5)-methyltransferase 1
MLPAIDIIYGGFPCQDISVAGTGAGLAGERSGLVFDLLRLVGECRPRFVFLENVPALAVRGLDRVLLELHALGFDARWTVVSAAEVGAPHLRERIWILAHARSIGIREQSKPEPRGLGTPEPILDGAIWTMADSDGKRGIKRGAGTEIRERGHDSFRDGLNVANADIEHGHDVGHGAGQIFRLERRSAILREVGWESEPDVGRVAHGIPVRVDRLRGLGNAVVPAAAREAFMRLMGIKQSECS